MDTDFHCIEGQQALHDGSLQLSADKIRTVCLLQAGLGPSSFNRKYQKSCILLPSETISMVFLAATHHKQFFTLMGSVIGPTSAAATSHLWFFKE